MKIVELLGRVSDWSAGRLLYDSYDDKLKVSYRVERTTRNTVLPMVYLLTTYPFLTMAEARFMLGAHVRERPNEEREIIVSKPGGAIWRAGLPALLDQRLATTALVDYVVKLYFRQLPVEARLVGWETLERAVRAALQQAHGQVAEDWEYGEVVS